MTLKGNIFVLMVTGLVASALIGAAPATATAIYDPNCLAHVAPQQTSRALPSIDQFSVETGSALPLQKSSATYKLLACGSLLSDIDSTTAEIDSLVDRVEIKTAKGVKFTPTASLAKGTYAGFAKVNYLYNIDIGSHSYGGFASDIHLKLRVWRGANNDCPPNSVACYLAAGTWGQSVSASFYVWVIENSVTGRQTLHLGRLRSGSFMFPYQDAGLTMLDSLSFCKKFGSPVTNNAKCGSNNTAALPVRKNGNTSWPGCMNGNGTYKATATQRGGVSSSATESCVEWGLMPVGNKWPPEPG